MDAKLCRVNRTKLNEEKRLWTDKLPDDSLIINNAAVFTSGAQTKSSRPGSARANSPESGIFENDWSASASGRRWSSGSSSGSSSSGGSGTGCGYALMRTPTGSELAALDGSKSGGDRERDRDENPQVSSLKKNCLRDIQRQVLAPSVF